MLKRIRSIEYDKYILPLLSVILFITLLIIALGYNSFITYLILYTVVCICIFVENKFRIVSPAVLFMLYYTLMIGIAPIILIYNNIDYGYNYFLVNLFPLIIYAVGNHVFKYVHISFNLRKTNLKFCFKFISKENILRILLYISFVASAYYIYKNFNIYIGNNLNKDRISAMSGSGLLIFISQLPILVIPTMYHLYANNKTNKIKLVELIIYAAISILTLSITGFRTPLFILIIILFIMFVKFHNISNKKIIIVGIILVVCACALDNMRGNSSVLSFDDNKWFNTSNVLLVNSNNLRTIFKFFPDQIPFQHGYTYLINFIMLKPGPDLDFTLWLKEIIGFTFEGGGVTPTIIGEFYINFGYISIYIGMLLMGFLGNYINKLLDKNNYDFISVYLLVQYFHCISGGIANVIIPVIMYLLVNEMLSFFALKEDLDGGKPIK